MDRMSGSICRTSSIHSEPESLAVELSACSTLTASAQQLSEYTTCSYNQSPLIVHSCKGDLNGRLTDSSYMRKGSLPYLAFDNLHIEQSCCLPALWPEVDWKSCANRVYCTDYSFEPCSAVLKSLFGLKWERLAAHGSRT